MANRRQDRWTLVVLCLLALAFVQCTLAPATMPTPGATPIAQATTTVFTPPRGGTYTIATPGDAATMQPLLAGDGGSFAFQSWVYDSLLWPDAKRGGLLAPHMAQSYVFSEDGLTLTLVLRRDLRWSDGKPITADDVLFTFEKKRTLPLGVTLRDTFTSLTASDPYTLVFHLTQPNCTALLEANLTPLPKHYFENVDITNNEYNMKPPVSSGAFIMTEWIRSSQATFVANDLYFLGRPNFDKVVIRVVPSLAVANAAFTKGEVDYSGVEPVDWERMSKLPFGMALEMYNPLSYYMVGFRADHPFLVDKRVRQALSYAIDRQTMIDGVFLGHARPASSVVGEGNWAYSADVTHYDYNPQKAKDLLRAAGWTPGPDGILVKDGKPFKLRLYYASTVVMFEQIAVMVQKQYREIGVSVEVSVENWATYINRLQNTRDYDIFVGARGVGDVHNALRPYMSGNDTKYENPEIDRLRTAAATVPGCREEDRQKLYAQAFKILTDDAPIAFLLTGASMQIFSTRLEIGWDAATSSNWMIYKWCVKPCM